MIIMSELWVPLISAVITGLLSLMGVYMANSKSSALIAYRLQKLEEKVNEHNQIVSRTYALEGKVTELEHNVSDLKKGA